MIFVVMYIYIYMYIYGYLTGIPRSLKNIKDGKAECIDLDIASNKLSTFYNIFIQTGQEDIIKERMRLTCRENGKDSLYF